MNNSDRYKAYQARLQAYADRMPVAYLQLQLWRDYRRKMMIKRGTV